MLVFYLSLLEEEHRPLFAEFYTRYERRLYAVALGILKNPALAEDAVSAAILKIIEHFEQFLKIYEKSRSEIAPWAVTIVKNTALNMRAKEGRTVALDESWDAPGRADTEEEAAFFRLLEIIHTMPEHYRRILELRFVEECSLGEIARSTGLSETAVKGRIQRGRALLLERLREEGCEYDRR